MFQNKEIKADLILIKINMKPKKPILPKIFGTKNKLNPNKIKTRIQAGSQARQAIKTMQSKAGRKLTATEMLELIQQQIKENLLEQKGAKGIIEETTMHAKNSRKEEIARWAKKISELRRQEKNARITIAELKKIINSRKTT